MAILVTGGAGYIGSHTVIQLLNLNNEIVIVDNHINSSSIVYDRIKELANDKFKTYNVDILDTEGLRKVFKENKIDSVIHFAGLKAVGESVEKPLYYYENNVTGTINLLNVMKEYNCKKIVFSSSATVYGMDNVSPLKEEDKIGGTTNPYGTSKYFIERILQDTFVANNDFAISILRYFNPIGAHKSGRIGENPNGIPNNLMPYVTQVAVGKRECLSIFGDDYDTHDGTGVRDYIHVEDLAMGHVKALEYINKHKGCHVHNLGTGNGVSVLDLVNAFMKENNIKINYKIVDRRAGDIATCYSSPEKAKKELGFEAKYTINDMVKDSWNWQKNNPNGYE